MIEFKKVFKKLGIVKNENILVNSDIQKILIYFKRNKIDFDPNNIIEAIIEIVGNDGTLMFPTYNWDFCERKIFDYNRTPSRSGSLSKVALKRSDFKRSKNPIYSFAIFGKNKDYLTSLKHENSFDLNSPFGFLIDNKGKNLFIDLDYKESLTFVHVAEQAVGVSYRYLKNFSSYYKDSDGNKSLASYQMYVRNEDFEGSTVIDKKMDQALENKGAIKSLVLNNISFTLVDISIAYHIMLDDIKKKTGIVYPKKSHV